MKLKLELDLNQVKALMHSMEQIEEEDQSYSEILNELYDKFDAFVKDTIGVG